ncbi:MAG: hypothetical protein V5A59_05360 [Bacteroidales bacterium]|nr:hypothetical protein [Bacteroidales bacterium]MBS3776340.1 hypothetical protein [Bacteroidales bacterium]
MKKLLWIILAILLLALLTRPDSERHKKKINREFKGENPVTGVLGAGKVFSELVNYHNGYLFSYTTFRDETVSFGIFRTVFVFKDLDLTGDE